MKPNYAICRTEKIKTWGSLSKSVGHNLRTSNEDRSHLRQGLRESMRILDGEADWLPAWKEQVEGMHLRKLQQGQAHTLAREFFLGMSPEWAEGKSKREIDDWAKANIEWLHHRFGRERVKLAVLHLDEQTPHIAAYVVPLKADAKKRGNGWTLSDRELGIGGNKSGLVELQDEYAAAMATFALSRGVRGSKATHKKTNEWRREQKKADQLTPVKVPTPEPATVIDRLNIEDYGKRVADQTAKSVMTQMKPYHRAALDAAKEQRVMKDELGVLRQQMEHLKDLAEAFKAFLTVLLGRAPDLDSIAGVQEALGAAASLAKAANKHAHSPPPSEASPSALPERRPMAAPVAREGPKQPKTKP